MKIDGNNNVIHERTTKTLSNDMNERKGQSLSGITNAILRNYLYLLYKKDN